MDRFIKVVTCQLRWDGQERYLTHGWRKKKMAYGSSHWTCNDWGKLLVFEFYQHEILTLIWIVLNIGETNTRDSCGALKGGITDTWGRAKED